MYEISKPYHEKLLQELMKTFEDIPSKVREYPQIRKDIKNYLEIHSDRGQRVLYELSKRMTCLEAGKKSEQHTKGTAGNDQDVLVRLDQVETNLETRLNLLESKMTAAFEEQTALRDDGGADIIDKIIDKIDEVRAAVDTTTDDVRVMGRSQHTLGNKLDGIAGDVASAKEQITEVAKGMVICEQRPSPSPISRSYASVAASHQIHRPALHSMAVTFEDSLETAEEVLASIAGH